MFQRVIIPTDGSDRELWALEEAVRFAKSLKVDVFTLSVVPAVDNGQRATKGGHAAMDTFAKKKEEHATTAVARLAAIAKKLGVKCATEVLHGNPAEVIAASARPGDLIVMPTKGLGSHVGVRIGSVTAQVVETAPCPVLVYKAPEDEVLQAGSTSAARPLARVVASTPSKRTFNDD